MIIEDSHALRASERRRHDRRERESIGYANRRGEQNVANSQQLAAATRGQWHNIKVGEANYG